MLAIRLHRVARFDGRNDIVQQVPLENGERRRGGEGSPEQLIPDPQKTKEQLKLLWLSCGNKDGLIRISQRTQRHLKEKYIRHMWNVDGDGHEGTHWRNNLYHFAQLLFNDEAAKAALTRPARAEETPPPPAQEK